jgi:hypothetical protein
VGHDAHLPQTRVLRTLRFRLRDRLLYGTLCLFSVFTAVVPFCRSLYRVELNYVEGWNVYIASALAHHATLYSSKYSWTTVNYPVLYFYVLGLLSRLTHDYLFTGRFLSLSSLLICCVFVGAIVRRVTGVTTAAILSAFFCLALFCARADQRVGMNDPQILAQVFFLGGLFLYVSRRPGMLCLAGTAFLFVLGGDFKHNSVDFPIAVLLDLYIVSRRRAFNFLVWAAVFLSVAIFCNIYIGGPFFAANLLTPRLYSISGALKSFLEVYGTIQIPFLAAALMVVPTIKASSSRVLALLFVVSLIIGIAFAGGAGVALNTFFSNLFAIAILVGILIANTSTNRIDFLRGAPYLRLAIPSILFGSLLFLMPGTGQLRPVETLRTMREGQLRFERQVSFLQSEHGPVLCESLLRCYFAGKPYVYDPFNSTSLIRAGRLDGGEIVDKIQKQEYGAIQLHSPVESITRPNEHFVDDILEAITKYYTPSLRETDCTIYVPRAGSPKSGKGSGNSGSGRELEDSH